MLGVQGTDSPYKTVLLGSSPRLSTNMSPTPKGWATVFYTVMCGFESCRGRQMLWKEVKTKHERMLFYKGQLVYKKWIGESGASTSALFDKWGHPRRWSRAKTAEATQSSNTSTAL